MIFLAEGGGVGTIFHQRLCLTETLFCGMILYHNRGEVCPDADRRQLRLPTGVAVAAWRPLALLERAMCVGL